MPRTFVAHVVNPSEAFSRLKHWADTSGYHIAGDAAGGHFRGMPRGIAGILIGEISGAYAVSGSVVTIQVDKDLPAGPVANALSKHGLKLLQSH